VKNLTDWILRFLWNIHPELPNYIVKQVSAARC